MNQKLLLKICGGVMVVGLGILAIDKFVVRRGETPRDQRYAKVAHDLGFELATADTQAKEFATLRKRLEPFAKVTGTIANLGPVMTRSDEVRAVSLFEYSVRKTAINRTGPRPDSSVDITLLGILIDFAAPLELPAWQRSETAPTPPFTLEAV